MDAFLSERLPLTRSRIQALIREGAVTIDGQIEQKTGFSLRAGQIMFITIPETAPALIEAQDIPLTILYQDDDLAVVAKPSGMVVHPAAGNPDGTLVNALMHRLDGLSGIGGELRPGIVHRLDKDTSGLLLVAKNDASHLRLSEQLKRREVERAYLAIVHGHFKDSEGYVEGAIARHPTDRKKMAIVPGGRDARTEYTVLKELRGASLIEARLTTGRTHQIRVHMASIGRPVLGDLVYGPKKMPHPVKGGQLLHACRVGFMHPTTGEYMRFETPPEPRFEEWLKKLESET